MRKFDVQSMVECWTTQADYPILDVNCSKQGNPRIINIKQRPISPEAGSQWVIPIRLHAKTGVSISTIMSSSEIDIKFNNLSDSDWVYVNPGAISLCRVLYDNAMLTALREAEDMDAEDMFRIEDDHNFFRCLKRSADRNRATSQPPAAGDDCVIPGHLDLCTAEMLNISNCECLNESDDHPLANFLKTGSAYLESDCDGQLILNLTFRQLVKLQSISIKAPSDKGPRKLRLFVNQPCTIGFDQASSMEAVQELVFTKDQLTKGTPVSLHLVKFQNVSNLLVSFISTKYSLILSI